MSHTVYVDYFFLQKVGPIKTGKLFLKGTLLLKHHKLKFIQRSYI